jgi:hypothetical protein
MKKIIDLADGAKILNGDELEAHKMLEIFITMLPQMREELSNAYSARVSNPATFHFVVEKFFDGLLYVGAPALHHMTNDLLVALNKKEELHENAVDKLYQQVLKGMNALEKKMANKSQ